MDPESKATPCLFLRVKLDAPSCCFIQGIERTSQLTANSLDSRFKTVGHHCESCQADATTDSWPWYICIPGFTSSLLARRVAFPTAFLAQGEWHRSFSTAALAPTPLEAGGDPGSLDVLSTVGWGPNTVGSERRFDGHKLPLKVGASGPSGPPAGWTSSGASAIEPLKPL